MLSTGETWFPQQYSQPIHISASWPASSPVSLVGEDKLGHWDPFFSPSSKYKLIVRRLASHPSLEHAV